MEPPLLFSGLFSARRFYLNLPPSLHSSSMCSRLPHAYSKSRSPSFPVPRSPRPLLFHPDYCYFRTRFDDPLREVQVATLVSDKRISFEIQIHSLILSLFPLFVRSNNRTTNGQCRLI